MRNTGFVLTLIFLSYFVLGQSRIFNKQEILEDLSFLQTQLQERHPNIEIYTGKKEFNDFFQNIVVSDSLSASEAYSTIALSNKIIKDGHTLFYPGQQYLNHNNETGLFLPVHPYWDGDKLYVLKNYSQSNKLISGHEIISINGVKSTELIKGMLNKMMRDGNNFTYPIWVLNTYFFEYYSYFYGCNNEYELVLREHEKDVHIKIKGIPKTKLFQKINDTKENSEKGISINLDKEKSTAIITIKDWHNKILRRYYKQKFKPEIKNMFKQIEHNNIENLIIDVRNNQGGDIKNSKYLLSYLLQEPFLLVEGYKKKKKGKIKNTRGSQMGTHKPFSSAFKGNLYVLTNGGSFSNTNMFCSALKRYNRATFIGEETGGSEFVICSNPKKIKLPNTEIIVELPTIQFLIKKYSKKNLHGIVPDFEVKPTIEDLIKEEDPVLEFTMELIKKK